ncbi:DUF6531 domain-containing protein, partial [Nonomuraea lactucae]|uniref:DUF6531 domain-containing protein n=1 Tax=Nonomuraea lactucae TaxID=2249762 RepID=UPI0013B4512C
MLVAALPGLLSLAVLPAYAQAGVVGGPAESQGPVTTPRQMVGTAGRLPSLVDASVTREGGAAGTRPGRRPSGVLALESRSATPEKRSKLAAGVERANQLDRMTQADPTFPIIDDAYPEHGMLVSTTPLLAVNAIRMGGGSAADLKFYFTICERPDDEEDPLPGEPTPTPVCVESGGQVGQNTWRVPPGKLAWGKQYEWWARAVDVESAASDETSKLVVTTGARQPLTSAHLGERSGNGQEFTPATGNYTSTFVDAKVTVAGPPLSVTRTYNSLDARTDGIFGAGWSTQWDMKITAEGTAGASDLLVTYPSGRRVRFAGKGDGTYQAPPGMHAVL